MSTASSTRMTLIKNVKVSANGTTCACGSWLNHWKRFSRRSLPVFCPVDGCMYPVSVGAHVQMADTNQLDWYIAPLCSAHSHSKEVLDYLSWCPLVPVGKQETCERRDGT